MNIFRMKTLLFSRVYYKQLFRYIFISNMKNDNHNLETESFENYKMPQNVKEIDISDSIRFDRNINDARADRYTHLVPQNDNYEHIMLKIELICAEFNYIKRTTLLVPSIIKDDDMNELLLLNPLQRQSYFMILYIRETFKIRRKLKNMIESECKENQIDVKCEEPRSTLRTGLFDQNGHLVYGLWHNCLTLRFGKNSRNVCVHRLKNAALFGTKLVIDFNFENEMSRAFIRDTIQQINYIYNDNRYSYANPFDLYFSNLPQQSHSYRLLLKLLPKMHSPDSFLTIESQSYRKLFPNDRIVYISTFASEALQEYDHNCVYVLGGIADDHRRVSSATIDARDSGIKVMRLPIKEHITEWSQNKYICISHIVGILNQVKDGIDWKTAFINNLPLRKISESMYKRAVSIQMNK